MASFAAAGPGRLLSIEDKCDEWMQSGTVGLEDFTNLPTSQFLKFFNETYWQSLPRLAWYPSLQT